MDAKMCLHTVCTIELTETYMHTVCFKDDIKQRNMMIRGRELWRNKYRNVFSR
jgi:hypothetical protein